MPRWSAASIATGAASMISKDASPEAGLGGKEVELREALTVNPE
jgi:hypothetical protein